MCAGMRVFPVAEMMEEVWMTARQSGVSSTVHPGSPAHGADRTLPGTSLSVTAHVSNRKRPVIRCSLRISEHISLLLLGPDPERLGICHEGIYCSPKQLGQSQACKGSDKQSNLCSEHSLCFISLASL